MDALAGYGSDSGSDESNKVAAEGGGALSGLLAQYSDDSDDDEHEHDVTIDKQKNGADANKPEVSSSNKKADDTEGKEVNGDGHPKKRRRRWDNPSEETSVNIDSVLPPPQLSVNSDTNNNDNGLKKEDSFQSMLLFPKDYATELRQKLARQLQIQSSQTGSDMSKEKQQLNTKLEQLHNKFHSNNDSKEKGAATAESFAKHLKSQHEFGNPHLLKTIIEHFDISPLESHVGKNSSFKSFEYVDRLMSAEERARIAAANYHGAPSASGMGGEGG